MNLTDEERNDIAEILSRRISEISTFKSDLENRVASLSNQPIRFHELPGSVELAMSREIARLSRLESKIKVPKIDR